MTGDCAFLQSLKRRFVSLMVAWHESLKLKTQEPQCQGKLLEIEKSLEETN